MPSKGDLAQARTAYVGEATAAAVALANGRYKDALRLALGTLDDVDAMIQYRAKYEKTEVTSVETIDLILRYAPLLLDTAAIDELASVLKRYKRIDRVIPADLASETVQARRRTEIACNLHSIIRREGHIAVSRLLEQLPADERPIGKAILLEWLSMGIATKQADASESMIELTTVMARPARGVCFSCGAEVTAPKRLLAQGGTCPGCRKKSIFVLRE